MACSRTASEAAVKVDPLRSYLESPTRELVTDNKKHKALVALVQRWRIGYLKQISRKAPDQHEITAALDSEVLEIHPPGAQLLWNFYHGRDHVVSCLWHATGISIPFSLLIRKVQFPL